MQDPQWLHVFVDIRADVADVSAKFWSAALGCRVGDPWPNHPEFRSFEPANGDAYLHHKWATTGRAFISTWR